MTFSCVWHAEIVVILTDGEAIDLWCCVGEETLSTTWARVEIYLSCGVNQSVGENRRQCSTPTCHHTHNHRPDANHNGDKNMARPTHTHPIRNIWNNLIKWRNTIVHCCELTCQIANSKHVWQHLQIWIHILVNDRWICLKNFLGQGRWVQLSGKTLLQEFL